MGFTIITASLQVQEIPTVLIGALVKVTLFIPENVVCQTPTMVTVQSVPGPYLAHLTAVIFVELIVGKTVVLVSGMDVLV